MGVMRWLYRILEERLECLPGYQRMIPILLQRIFFCLQQPRYYQCSYISFQVSAKQSVVDKILVFMREHPRRLTREEIAEALGYNGSYLNRVFSAHMGQSLADYNRQIYLREAAELLLNTNLSVSEIAVKIGFESKSAFYEQFGKKYGLTPGEYRHAPNGSPPSRYPEV